MLWWAFTNRKRPPHLLLRDAMVHFEQRRGRKATSALMHESVIAAIAKPPIPVEGRAHVPVHTVFLSDGTRVE